MPNLIPFFDLKKENADKNLELAFTTAEKDLGIPKFLDPEDMSMLVCFTNFHSPLSCC